MKKLLICASLMALFGVHAEAVTFVFVNDFDSKERKVMLVVRQGKGDATYEMDMKPVHIRQGVRKKRKKIDLLNFFQKAKPNGSEPGEGDVRFTVSRLFNSNVVCNPELDLEKDTHTAEELNNKMIVTLYLGTDPKNPVRPHMSCSVKLD